MAQALSDQARWIGQGHAIGLLYRIADYPAFVPDPSGGQVLGDLFVMNDPHALLTRIDDYEECTDRFAQPHEYRRTSVPVYMTGRTIEAWAYVYAWPVDAASLIIGGDFLS